MNVNHKSGKLFITIAVTAMVTILAACDAYSSSGSSGAMQSKPQWAVAMPSAVSTAEHPLAPPPTVGPHWTPNPTAQVTPGTMPAGQVASGDFGVWQYTAFVEPANGGGTSNGVTIRPGDVIASVHCAINTRSSIDAYVASNKQLLPQVVQESGLVEVWVIFSQYQSVDNFRAWVKKHNLKVRDTHLRGIDGDVYKDMPIRSPEGTSDPLPNSRMKVIDDYNAHNYPTMINKGVYAVRTWADSKELSSIAAETFVYFVDVTPSIVQMDLANKGVEGARQADVQTCGADVSYVVETGSYDKSK